MKPTNLINSLLTLTISLCLFVDLNAQVMIIPDVPDLQQPIDPWWGNLPDNACAPVSAANICVYWDDSIHHSNAVGLNSRLMADSIPSFLYYFMGTNGMGDPTRANPSFYGITPGTITVDIDTGFKEYVRWDTSNMFFTPKPFSIPTSKTGFDWKIERDEIMGFHLHMMEMNARRPDIVVFKYWNPDTTGIVMANEMGGDSIHFLLWDSAVSNADFPHPHEDWYFDEKPNSAGHAVTGVGYLFGWDPDEGGPLPLTDWIICHDNWTTTPVNVAVPWVDTLWIATFTADPGHDTILPYISCVDTTVYLDGSGQYQIDESYIVDSAWDNNGVDQLFLDDYYFLCPYTATPQAVTATAMDMFGNMAQCTASVTVMDTIDPTMVCTDTTIYLDTSGSVTIDSTYVLSDMSDNCKISSVLLSRNVFSMADLPSPQPVSLTVYDESGNSSRCEVLITVLDTIASSVTNEFRFNKNFEFSVIPNPSDGIFKIESKTPVGNCMLELFSLNGVLLYKKNLHKGKAELNISDFSKGVYVLKVTGKEGREYRDRVIIR